MNTKDNWLITATFLEDERRAVWSEIFPGAVVPIQSPVTRKVNVPGRLLVDAYMLDLDALNDKQLDAVVQVFVDEYGFPFEEVRREVLHGLPIIAEGVSVLVRGMAYFSAMTGFDEIGTPFWDHDEDLHGLQEFEED